MWGRPVSAAVCAVSAGNTPTRVGKTAKHVQFRQMNEKHPHACGEDSGSSLSSKRVTRNTPTRVGKTSKSYYWKSKRRKHPHACGEDDDGVSTDVIAFRNTPTRVGKTCLLAFCDSTYQKHPHACGEDDADAFFACGCVETPPRVWGRRFDDRLEPDDFRNTPTRVGKTYSLS